MTISRDMKYVIAANANNTIFVWKRRPLSLPGVVHRAATAEEEEEEGA